MKMVSKQILIFISLIFIASIFIATPSFARENPIPDKLVYPGAELLTKEALYNSCLRQKQFDQPGLECGVQLKLSLPTYPIESEKSVLAEYTIYDGTDFIKIADWYLATMPSLGFVQHKSSPQKLSENGELLSFCKTTDKKCLDGGGAGLYVSFRTERDGNFVIATKIDVTITNKDYLTGFTPALIPSPLIKSPPPKTKISSKPSTPPGPGHDNNWQQTGLADFIKKYISNIIDRIGGWLGGLFGL